jgi:hypothetical protein
MTNKHQACQYLWAKKYMHATWMDWSYIIFLDDSNFNLFGSDGQHYYWKRNRERLLDQHVQLIVKFGGGNIMIWRCMS